jgi:cbb3-type cytochrome oxidase maturation protein
VTFGADKKDLMGIIFLLIAASTVVAVIFLAAFVWAMRTGQYDDDRSPAVRILGEPRPASTQHVNPTKKELTP